MFVGDTGIARVVKRTLEVMEELEAPTIPPRCANAGAIDLPTLQRYLNFWFSSSLDLVRRRESRPTPPRYFASGIKGRPDEERVRGPSLHARRPWRSRCPTASGGIVTETVPLRNAMNEVDARAPISAIARCGWRAGTG